MVPLDNEKHQCGSNQALIHVAAALPYVSLISAIFGLLLIVPTICFFNEKVEEKKEEKWKKENKNGPDFPGPAKNPMPGCLKEKVHVLLLSFFLENLPQLFSSGVIMFRYAFYTGPSVAALISFVFSVVSFILFMKDLCKAIYKKASETNTPSFGIQPAT